MFLRFTWLLFPILATLAARLASGQHLVDVSLTSDMDGQSVPPGTQIDWEISALVTGGDSSGLALITLGLVQDEANPELFDLPPADGVPPGMDSFAPPDGLSNPDQAVDSFGYRGTRMAGNLRQIGGGQNTSGEESIVEGVGLGPQRQVIAAGSFPAPQTPGTYVLHLDAPLANVLVAVNPPPASSPTEPADVTVTLPGSRMEFTVGCRCGDIDGVGSKVNLGDFGMFALCYGRSAPSGDCTTEVFECSDLDGSGAVNLSDFGTFALLYGSLSTNAVPDCLP